MQRALDFQPGGLLSEGAFYVERSTDQELLTALLSHEYCWVLGPRQSGKSSLRDRVARKLRSQQVLCANIDHGRIGSTNVTAEDWFYGAARQVSRDLQLKSRPGEFWSGHDSLEKPVHRWDSFLRDEVLTSVCGDVVIFVDEIDLPLALPFFADDFLSSLWRAYEARRENTAYNRLTFCLMGGKVPWELVRDYTMPLRLGPQFRLQDFTFEQAQAFLPGLERYAEDPAAVLDAVLRWAGGHPYMIQRICHELTARLGTERPLTRGQEVRRVEEVAHDLFLLNGRIEDYNLKWASDQFAPERENDHTRAMRELYRRLLNGEQVSVNPQGQVQTDLWLTGLATERDGFLRVRNRIFGTVFDQKWAGGA